MSRLSESSALSRAATQAEIDAQLEAAARSELAALSQAAAKAENRFTEEQQGWMREALYEARLAFELGDVPVGAVLVADGEIIGRGHNRREADNDPCGHAEMIALTQAGKALGSWRLSGAQMYVTMEPCPMCAFALVLARVQLLVYGMSDQRMGACGSFLNIAQFPGFGHAVSIRSGLYADESARLMRDFFNARRKD